MVAAAKAEAERRGLKNVGFRQCEADALPFGDKSFDAVVCRLGVMFFPDPLAALREMLRVAKPGGKISLAVWFKSELNPFTHIVTDLLSRYVASPPADPDAPGAFRFAENGKLARVLARAGAANVDERLLHFLMEAPITVEDYWTLRAETSDTLRAKLATMPANQVESLREDVLQAARAYFPENQMRFPTQMIIATGERSV